MSLETQREHICCGDPAKLLIMLMHQEGLRWQTFRPWILFSWAFQLSRSWKVHAAGQAWQAGLMCRAARALFSLHFSTRWNSLVLVNSFRHTVIKHSLNAHYIPGKCQLTICCPKGRSWEFKWSPRASTGCALRYKATSTGTRILLFRNCLQMPGHKRWAQPDLSLSEHSAAATLWSCAFEQLPYISQSCYLWDGHLMWQGQTSSWLSLKCSKWSEELIKSLQWKTLSMLFGKKREHFGQQREVSRENLKHSVEKEFQFHGSLGNVQQFKPSNRH